MKKVIIIVFLFVSLFSCSKTKYEEGLSLAKNHKEEEVLKIIQTSELSKLENGMLYYTLGKYYVANDIEKAEKYLLQSSEIIDKSVENGRKGIIDLVGDSIIKGVTEEDTKKMFTIVVNSNYLLVSIYLYQGKYDSALKIIDSMEKLSIAQNVDSNFFISDSKFNIYFMKKDFDKAYEVVKQEKEGDKTEVFANDLRKLMLYNVENKVDLVKQTEEKIIKSGSTYLDIGDTYYYTLYTRLVLNEKTGKYENRDVYSSDSKYAYFPIPYKEDLAIKYLEMYLKEENTHKEKDTYSAVEALYSIYKNRGYNDKIEELLNKYINIPDVKDLKKSYEDSKVN